MRRVLTWVGKSFILLVLSIVVLGGSQVHAANSCGPNATWSFNSSNGELKIAGTGKTTSSPWLTAHRQSIKSISIDRRITGLSYWSFKGCKNLKSVTIHKELTDAGRCFEGSGITSITFEAGSQGIPTAICAGAESLKSVQIPDSVTRIWTSAFEGCTSLSNIKLPSRLQAIDPYAFDRCSSLKSITIPNTVTRGIRAFRNAGLETATLQPGMKMVPGSLFAESSLKNISIPDSVTVIPVSAFEDCKALKEITLPASITSIEIFAFSRSGLHTIRGVYNSYAHTYAKNNGYRFIADGKAVQLLSFSTIPVQKHTGKAITPAVTVKDGSKTLRAGQHYSISYRNNTKVGTATVEIRGRDGYYSGSKSFTFKIAAKKGKTYTVGNLKYKVLNDSTKGRGTVSVAGLARNVRSVTIPKTLRMGSFKYKITAIEKRAFYRRSRLKTIKIKSTSIKKMGSRAFTGINKKARITIPRSKRSSYKKLLKRAGVSKTVKIK